MENNKINTELIKVDEITAYLNEFLMSNTEQDELIISNDKKLRVRKTDGKHEMILEGKFVPQDSIKNQLANKNVFETTILIKYNDNEELIVGTHNRVDYVFTAIQSILEDVIVSDVVATYENVYVTDGDFMGNKLMIASLKGPVTKANRFALNV